MRVHAIGVSRSSGKARDTGNNYDIAELYYLRPIDQVQNNNRTVVGAGQQQGTLNVSPDAFSKFLSITFPRSGLFLDLTIENIPGRFGRGMDSQVVDFKVVEQAKAA